MKAMRILPATIVVVGLLVVVFLSLSRGQNPQNARDDALSHVELKEGGSEPVRIRETLLCSLPNGVQWSDCIISPAYDSVAYRVSDGQRSFYVIDGISQSSYHEVGEFVFSPDGTRHAYWGKTGKLVFSVIDGKEAGSYDDVSSFRFSADSKRWACAVNHVQVVVDGVPRKKYGGVGRPLFSPDSRRLAFIAIEDWEAFVVVDGEEGTRYEAITRGSVTFSPDSRRVAYLAKRNNRWLLVCDGDEGTAYGEGVFRRVALSSDGKRTAFVTAIGGGFSVIVDGVPGPVYDGIQNEGPVFSADSRSCAYGARRGNARFCVLDGTEGDTYDGVSGLTFHPRGGDLTYFAQKGDKWCIVEAGIRGDLVECLGKGLLVYSRDGSHSAHAQMNSDRTYSVFLDGTPIGSYANLYVNEGLRFDEADALVFVATRGKDVYRVQASGSG